MEVVRLVREQISAAQDALSNLARAIEGSITGFLQIVAETAIRIPGVRFGLVQPIRRLLLECYEFNFNQISQFFVDEVLRVNLPNVINLGSIPSEAQVFEMDGVHLKKESGIMLLRQFWIRPKSFSVRSPLYKIERMTLELALLLVGRRKRKKIRRRMAP